jgi:hypothetical protein
MEWEQPGCAWANWKKFPGSEDPGYTADSPHHVSVVARLFRGGDFLSAAFMLDGTSSLSPGKQKLEKDQCRPNRNRGVGDVERGPNVLP